MLRNVRTVLTGAVACCVPAGCAGLGTSPRARLHRFWFVHNAAGRARTPQEIAWLCVDRSKRGHLWTGKNLRSCAHFGIEVMRTHSCQLSSAMGTLLEARPPRLPPARRSRALCPSQLPSEGCLAVCLGMPQARHDGPRSAPWHEVRSRTRMLARTRTHTRGAHAHAHAHARTTRARARGQVSCTHALSPAPANSPHWSIASG